MDSVELAISQAWAKIAAALAGMGTVGLIIAGVVSVAMIYFLAKYRKMKQDKAQAETEKKRKEAEAQNPIDNKEDEDDMAAGEDEINKKIKELNND